MFNKKIGKIIKRENADYDEDRELDYLVEDKMWGN